MTVINFIRENAGLFWLGLAVVGCIYYAVKALITWLRNTPKEEQLEAVRVWLLAQVTEAQEDWGADMGEIKRSAVWGAFIAMFPQLLGKIPITLFDAMLKEALKRMHELLERKKEIEAGKDPEELPPIEHQPV